MQGAKIIKAGLEVFVLGKVKALLPTSNHYLLRVIQLTGKCQSRTRDGSFLLPGIDIPFLPSKAPDVNETITGGSLQSSPKKTKWDAIRSPK